MARAVTQPEELLRLLDLDPSLLAGARRGAGLFALRVPRGYVARMRPGDPHDPLLRQVLPLEAETQPAPGFSTDPVGDLPSAATPGVLHKYRGRVLLVVTGACAVHCRYCFRRHFPYAEQHAGRERWRPALDYLRARPDINEVILSGGDPLSVTDTKLAGLSAALREIPHIRRLRLHTRTPVVLPERVDDALLDWLRPWGRRALVVLHANHANEVDAAVAGAVERLRGIGVTLLNQAVLLQGVNDTADAQVELAERLFEAGVLPYYLHLLDPVQGAAHFDVAERTGHRLVEEISVRLPGYLVPKLVREAPGAPAKRPVSTACREDG